MGEKRELRNVFTFAIRGQYGYIVVLKTTDCYYTKYYDIMLNIKRNAGYYVNYTNFQ